MSIPIQRYFQLLARYLYPQRRQSFLLAGLLLTNIGLSLVNPQIMRYFIDNALPGAEWSNLINAALLFLLIAVLGQLLFVASGYLSQQVAWTATNALRVELLAHVLKLDMSFHKTHTPGELIERIDGDVSALARFFTSLVTNIVANLILLLGILLLLWREDWRAALAMALFAVVAIWVLVRLRDVAVPQWERLRQIEAEFYGFLGEHLSSTEDLRANGATGYVMNRFLSQIQRWFPLQRRASLAGYSMWMVNDLVFALSNLVIFGVGAYLWYQGVLTIGAVYLLFNYKDLLRGPLAQIRDELTDLQRASASIERIERLQQQKSSVQDGHGALITHGALAVTFDDVSFSYTDGVNAVDLDAHDREKETRPVETVLQNLTFHLAPGRVMGLLGRTGSGKSTIARLLLRLYDPSTGEIRLGDVCTIEATLLEVRQHVGMVTQDVQLFQASVRDNLTFFDPSIADGRILAVLDDLGLGDWLRSLPSSLDTQLSADGGGLSAGQAQLLAFARIFLADPGLVILDEASSRLDPATEQLIERAVSKLLHGRTAILIAHRLATIQRADEILILDKGRILEQGERLQLAADPASHFHQLLKIGLEEVLV